MATTSAAAAAAAAHHHHAAAMAQQKPTFPAYRWAPIAGKTILELCRFRLTKWNVL